MKLIKSLLLAPAALGLLAPMSVAADELNIFDVSIYSSSKKVKSISDFDHPKEVAANKMGVDYSEARFNKFEAGSFSDTTTASFSANSLIGAVDGSTVAESVAAIYDFQIDLFTSFNGEDNFAVELIAGSGLAGLTDIDLISNANADVLNVDGVSYQFPIGDKTQVIVGNNITGSALFNTACAYDGFTAVLDDCGNAQEGISLSTLNSLTGSSLTSLTTGVSVSYEIGDGWTAALGYNGEGSSTDGLLTKAGQDIYGGQISYTGDSYGVSLTMANLENSIKWTTAVNEYYADILYYALNAYWKPEQKGFVPSVSVGFENSNVEADETTETDTNQWFVGFQWDEAGPGKLGAAIGSAGPQFTDDSEDLSMFELLYTYPVYDGMTITPAIFVIETAAGTEDLTGLMVMTSFSF